MRKNRLTRKLAAAKAALGRNGYLTQIGWLASFSTSLPVDQQGNPLPWYTYGAIAFLQDRIRPEMAVFEFGSGNSTLWWSQRVAQVVSREHDAAWYQRVKALVPANVDYQHIACLPDGDYAREVLKHVGRFDLIVIDGPDRVNCARHALQALKAHGAIIWDNSDREEYAAGYSLLTQAGFRRLDFSGMGPINPQGWCTSIFYRPDNCLGI